MGWEVVLIKSESVFLTTFFKSLNAAGICYAVMRNYALPPESVRGSDLDIRISPKDKTQFREVLHHSIERASGVAISCAYAHGFFYICAFGYNPNEHSSWWGVRIDVYERIGHLYNVVWAIDLDPSFKPQTMQNGIKDLVPGFAAVIGMLKEVLSNNHMPERYRQDAARIMQYDWHRLSSALAPVGKRGLALLRQIILADNGEIDLVRQSRALRRSLFVQAFKKSPIRFLCNRFLHEWSKVRRYLRPFGVVLAVLGVDGVGKSTVKLHCT